jgi:hypothetical protein
MTAPRVELPHGSINNGNDGYCSMSGFFSVRQHDMAHARFVAGLITRLFLLILASQFYHQNAVLHMAHVADHLSLYDTSQ